MEKTAKFRIQKLTRYFAQTVTFALTRPLIYFLPNKRPSITKPVSEPNVPYVLFRKEVRRLLTGLAVHYAFPARRLRAAAALRRRSRLRCKFVVRCVSGSFSSTVASFAFPLARKVPLLLAAGAAACLRILRALLMPWRMTRPANTAAPTSKKR